MPKEHRCSKVRGSTHHDLKGMLDHLQHCQEPQCREMDIRDLSQLPGRDGGQIPMV